jgi:hypothetical protein
MDTFVHQLSDTCVESVWTQLYTIYPTHMCNLYGDICSQVVRMMCAVCMETSVQ